MFSRYTSLLVLVAVLALTGCGGGSSDSYVVEPFNSYEAKLVGTYALSDFLVYENGVGSYTPAAFEVWGGALTLGDDRVATVAMEFCEHAGDPTVACDRQFVWHADAGLLYLEPMTSGEDGVMLEWVLSGMGQLTTESYIPSNLPGYERLLIDEGREAYDWITQD